MDSKISVLEIKAPRIRENGCKRETLGDILSPWQEGLFAFAGLRGHPTSAKGFFEQRPPFPRTAVSA
jgi:hypothetical protein